MHESSLQKRTCRVELLGCASAGLHSSCLALAYYIPHGRSSLQRKKVIFQGCRYKHISSCNTYMEVCAEILTCAGFHASDPQIIGPTLQQCATQMPFSSWYNIWCCQPSSVVPSQKGRLKILGRNCSGVVDHFIDKKRANNTKFSTNLTGQAVHSVVVQAQL